MINDDRIGVLYTALNYIEYHPSFLPHSSTGSCQCNRPPGHPAACRVSKRCCTRLSGHQPKSLTRYHNGMYGATGKVHGLVQWCHVGLQFRGHRNRIGRIDQEDSSVIFLLTISSIHLTVNIETEDAGTTLAIHGD